VGIQGFRFRITVPAGLDPRLRGDDVQFPAPLRWFAPDDLRSFGHRSRVMQMGYDPKDWEGKPVIAILNNWNDYQPLPPALQAARRGGQARRAAGRRLPAGAADGLAGENLIKPSALLYRNMLAMEVEEMIRAYPIDGAVLMGGCDKTTPGCCWAPPAPTCRHLPAGRAHAARHVARPDAGLGLRRLQVLGRAPRRHHQRAAVDPSSAASPAAPAPA
jgi:hypothetical protein